MAETKVIHATSIRGLTGASAYEDAVSTGLFKGTLEAYLESLKGIDGKSVYQLALDNGFVGTETDFLDSLRDATLSFTDYDKLVQVTLL